jgi:hypothetical protein
MSMPGAALLAQNRPATPPAAGGFGFRPPPPPPSGRPGAQIDLTGYWTSVISEDWRWRMVTPLKGDFANIPLNAAGQAIGEAWNPAKDEGSDQACKAYAAPGLFRLPEHLHIWWQDDQTLIIQVDAGMQTRILHFVSAAPAAGSSGATAYPTAPAGAGTGAAEAPSWQGVSIAHWEGPGRAAYFGAGLGLSPRGDTHSKALVVTTSNLRPGYLRKNGIPFSARTQMTEYIDSYTDPDSSRWILVTTIVQDPVYLTAPWVTTTDFKRLPDGERWRPAPCVAN